MYNEKVSMWVPHEIHVFTFCKTSLRSSFISVCIVTLDFYMRNSILTLPNKKG